MDSALIGLKARVNGIMARWNSMAEPGILWYQRDQTPRLTPRIQKLGPSDFTGSNWSMINASMQEDTLPQEVSVCSPQQNLPNDDLNGQLTKKTSLNDYASMGVTRGVSLKNDFGG